MLWTHLALGSIINAMGQYKILHVHAFSEVCASSTSGIVSSIFHHFNVRRRTGNIVEIYLRSLLQPCEPVLFAI